MSTKKIENIAIFRERDMISIVNNINEMKDKQKKKKGFNNNLIVLFGIVIFLSGLILGYFLFHTEKTNPFTNRVYLENKSGYFFTNPLLDCGNDNFFFKTAEMRKKKVEEIIKAKKEAGDIAEASVYFLGLNRGLWFGIKEDKEFTSASLVKIFVLITYLKEASIDASILEKEFTYEIFDTESDPLQEEFPPKSRLEEGKSYTIAELLERMIVYSANDATDLLTMNREDIDADLEKIFNDLDLSVIYREHHEILFSTKDFAKVLRILYNGSYLSHEMSEKALELLSRVEFKEGLRQGVRDDVIISNKFGQRTRLLDNNEVSSRQLHDCGIVYHELEPYILCVMSRGMEYDKLSSFVGEVSKTIFDTMEEELKKTK